VVAWLAQRTDKTTITKLLRVSWEAVARIVTIVVADGLDDARFEGLLRIGVDEISYRKGHRYLTVVADHDQEGAVVWAGEGKDAAALRRFYDLLGPERGDRLEAVSLDMGAALYDAESESHNAHSGGIFTFAVRVVGVFAVLRPVSTPRPGSMTDRCIDWQPGAGSQMLGIVNRPS